jgi:hypothetical protein
MKMNKRDFEMYIQGCAQHLYEDFGTGEDCSYGNLHKHLAWENVCGDWDYGNEMVRCQEFSKTEMIKIFRGCIVNAKSLLADLKEWEKRILRIEKMCEIFNIDFAEGEVFFIRSKHSSKENILEGMCDEIRNMKNGMEEAIFHMGNNVKKLRQKNK